MSADKTKWVDSLGVVHDLTTEKRVSTAIAAKRLGFGIDTIQAMIRRGDVYPVLRHNARRIEVYECAVADYIARRLNPRKAAA